jgi:hypothetical protein
MIRTVRDFTRHTTTASSIHPSWSKAALLAGAAGITFALAAGARPALAEDALGSPVAIEDLAEVRGGEIGNNFPVDTNSHNTTNTAQSNQTTTATNQDNAIIAGGDVPSGNFTIHPGGISDNRGMTNVVVNTAPQSNAQGIMSMSVVLH